MCAWCTCEHGCALHGKGETEQGPRHVQHRQRSTRATSFSIFAVASRHPVMILRLLLSPSCLPALHKAGQRTLSPKSRDCYCKPAFHSLSSSLILGFFHFRKEYRADGGDGCTTVRMYLMPLNCTLKNG